MPFVRELIADKHVYEAQRGIGIQWFASSERSTCRDYNPVSRRLYTHRPSRPSSCAVLSRTTPSAMAGCWNLLSSDFYENRQRAQGPGLQPFV